MSDKIGTRTLRVRYKGVFDFKGLYDQVYDWMDRNKYLTQEDKYKNKAAAPWGYEHEVSISGKKKVDEYYMYQVEVTLHAEDAAEIEHDGQKLLNGRITIVLDATLVRDYKDRFSGSKFREFLGKIYNRMTKKEMEVKHWDPLYTSLQGLQQEIKKHLNMYADLNY